MTRNYLTNKQRIAIQKEISKRRKEGQPLQLHQLSAWAQQELRLPFLPSKPVLSRLASCPPASVPQNDCKRNHTSAQPELEKTLITWVNDRNNMGQLLTGDLIKEKGKRLLADVNALLPQEKRMELKFTSGWLWNFQRRWNLRSRKLYGEAADIDEEVMNRAVPELQALCQNYRSDDVWNADETGINYAMPPDRTICTTPIPGRKKDKRRLTLLVCANASGTEKIPLMFIGNALRPRCFKKRTGSELGFDYWNNGKAWMTMILFFEWLQRFDTYIRRTPNRRVLLLVDNFSGHGSPECLPLLAAVKVAFLPPNTTARLQPMDAGIIACLKRRYRTVQYNRALDALDDNPENIYKIDQLTAMKYIKSVWNGIPGTVIRNCWKSCGLLVNTDFNSSGVYLNDVEEENNILKGVVSELVGTRRMVSIADLLNSDDADVLEEVHDEDLARNVVRNLGVGKDDGGELDDSEEGAEPLMPPAKQVEAIKAAIQIIEAQPEVHLQAQQQLQCILRALKKNTVQGLRQSRIHSYFLPQ